MILYFSGTGNSAYVAKKIGKEIQDETFNLFQKIRDRDFSEIHSDRPWVIVSPTYAWRIPRILQEWMAKTKFTGSKDIYFVMTCGENIGDAGSYVKKLCTSKGLNYLGCIPIIMPENYIALFSTPTQEKALEIIRQAEDTINNVSLLIKNGETQSQFDITFKDKIISGIVNDVFYPVFVHAKKFYVTEACISCGKCAKLCPLRNITLEHGKPIWNNHCTHCMACICHCPSEAIEYGRNSKGLTRYTCPKHI